MEIGDYVRYKTLSNQIKINKIKNIVEPDDSELSMTNIILYDLDNKDVTADKYIIKSSPNIIDLIEVGDYVNGKEVSSLQRYDDGTVADIRFYEEVEMQEYSFGEESDIKSIVTKEQFEAIKYEIK
jgi:hypothetical protein